MRRNYLIFSALTAFLSFLSGAEAVHGQSLADVARAEEARRKTVKEPAKVYTNDDLKAGGAEGGAAAPTPATQTTQTGTTKPADPNAKPEAQKPDTQKPDAQKPAADEPKKDEKYWKERMNALRDGVARNKVLVDALQSRINALNTDFANVDDPGQRAIIEQNRRTALAEMDRVNKETEKLNKSMFDLAEEARKASIPPGWLR
jgi:hypothetical protein